ncbi:MAG: vitamin K epoxide reductase family protein [Dehalococcoidia bacterium]|nr:vitamin K epoxide reductase family protein [Dehalococcoidia bacterium]
MNWNFTYKQLLYFRYCLLLIGFGITLYLIINNVLSSNSLACGSIGDCNKVQNSSYAYFYNIPVSVLGSLFYVFLIFLTSIQFYLNDRDYIRFIELICFSSSIVAWIFSMYLTFIEFFIIKEICIWCVATAFIVTLIFFLNLWTLVSLKRYGIKD